MGAASRHHWSFGHAALGSGDTAERPRALHGVGTPAFSIHSALLLGNREEEKAAVGYGLRLQPPPCQGLVPSEEAAWAEGGRGGSRPMSILHWLGGQPPVRTLKLPRLSFLACELGTRAPPPLGCYEVCMKEQGTGTLKKKINALIHRHGKHKVG